ncbi:MAG: alpha-L-fucosidase [Planctomycetota bacterium]
MRDLLLAAVLAFGLLAVTPARAEEYEPNWKSLEKHQEAPEWFKDAKFGIYTHWGLCTQANAMVPSANSGWYGHQLSRKGSGTYKAHTKKLGPPTEFGYHDFIPHFRAKKFDADRWARLFKQAGARFAGPVAEHHDGYSMWDSEVTPWNAADTGPKKDIAGRLERAIRERGMKFVMTFHHAACGRYEVRDGVKMPSWFLKREEAGTTDPKYRKLYHNMPADEFYELWQAKLIESIDKYQPDLIWHDSGLGGMPGRPLERGGGGIPESYIQEYLAYYFNQAESWGADVCVTYKQNDLPPEVGILDHERGREDELTEHVWLTDTSVGSWFYQGPGSGGRSAGWVVDELTEIVCRNGCMLLNVPPRPDGTFSEQVKKTLRGVGNWLEVNGEAIYGTRPWSVAEEGQVRYTKKEGAVYAICLEWPGDTLALQNLGGTGDETEVSSVELLGHDGELDWERDADALTIDVPSDKPCRHAYAFKIRISGRGVQGLTVEYGDSARQIHARSSVLNYSDSPLETTVSLRVNDRNIADTLVKLEPWTEKQVNFTHTFPDGTEDLFSVTLRGDGLGKATDAVSVPYRDLSGTWRFHEGDDMDWKAPDLDVSGWQTVELPASWEDHSGYEKDPAFGWYRRTVHVPESWKGGPLTLHLGKIDDADAAYVNGTKIGSMGGLPPDRGSAFKEVRRYTAPAEAVRFGEDNVIAIRVGDWKGHGGLYEGPLRMSR